MGTESMHAETWLQKHWTKFRIFLAVTAIKIILIPSYRSTDFEVHRNWMAITSQLPINQWYTNNTSEWTLDYPPLFAWFELFLAQFAKFVDPGMLQVENLDYANNATVIFMRGSVILTELVLATGVLYATRRMREFNRNVIFFLILANPGLIIVDHIHFQYNGLLLGILVWSLALISEGRDILGAILFAVLVNMKHLYAVLGPAYAIYLLRHYCRGSKAYLNFLKLAVSVLAVCGISFGPFIANGQIQQVLGRLFPFGRGLCHAYWAPNFWALYSFLDKILISVWKWQKIPIEIDTAMSTGGLVGGQKFAILPQISPGITILLTQISMSVVLFKLWRNPKPAVFMNVITFCALTSFVLGYHVHEKASLTATIPAALTAMTNPKSQGKYFFLVVTSSYAIFPLLFTPAEYLVKVFILVSYSLIALWLFHEDNLSQNEGKKDKKREEEAGEISEKGQFLNFLEIGYLVGLILVEIYASFLHWMILGEKLPFLPLMLISVYCSIGILRSWFCHSFVLEQSRQKHE